MFTKAFSVSLTGVLLHCAFCTAGFSGVAQTMDWPDPVANEVVPYETSGLTHGPLLGRPTSNSIRVWVRTLKPSKFTVRWSTTLPLAPSLPHVEGETRTNHDNTGFVDIAGIKPNTRYYYGVWLDGELADLRMNISDPWPSFRTLPDATTCADPANNPQGLFNVTFAIGHCASQDPFVSGGQYASTPAFDTLRRVHGEEVQFAIFNGDVIYEELRDGTIDGIRSNYKLYFSRGRSFAGLYRQMPGLFTFDDHDIGWDLHGAGETGLGNGPHLIRDIGLTAYQEYVSWANFSGSHSGRVQMGKARVEADDDVLFDPTADFAKLKPEQVSNIHLGPYTKGPASTRRTGKTPPNSGVFGLVTVLDTHRLKVTPKFKSTAEVDYSIGTHHYHDWKVGNCHFFALDTRSERTRFNKENRHDPKTFILGEAQRRWLMDGVRNTDAQFIFLISPDPWVVYHTAAHVSKEPGADRDDKGDGFPSFVNEREILIKMFDELPKPVLIFTGDVHASGSVRITDNVWEMMCGPLGSTGHPLGTLGNPPKGGTFDSQGRTVQVRWVSGFPNNMPYQRIRNCYYSVVQVNNVLKVGTPTSASPQWNAYDAPQVVVRWHDGYTGRLVYAESISTLDAQ